MTHTKRARSVGVVEIAALAEFRFRLRRFLSFSETTAEAHGIQAQQYLLLQAIAAVPEGQEPGITYVAERMMLRHNSAVELVDRAEKAGIVRRVADESDHRRSLVQSTDLGRELMGLIAAKHLMELRAEGPELIRALERLIGEGVAKRMGER